MIKCPFCEEASDDGVSYEEHIEEAHDFGDFEGILKETIRAEGFTHISSHSRNAATRAFEFKRDFGGYSERYRVTVEEL